MKVIVGLGNPGIEYKNTRHNLGFHILDRLSEKMGFSISSGKYKSLIHREGDVIFCKPQTFMNGSGEALREIKNLHKLENKDFLVIYDDLHIPVGSFKCSLNRGSGGHNGIKSIIESLGSNGFPRLRVGIGPRERADVISDYVLSRFTSEDAGKIEKIIPEILESIGDFIGGVEFEKIQNKFNFPKVFSS